MAFLKFTIITIILKIFLRFSALKILAIQFQALFVNGEMLENTFPLTTNLVSKIKCFHLIIELVVDGSWLRRQPEIV